MNWNGFKMMASHSHVVSYFKRTERLVDLAKNNGCQMVCYGHTHIFNFEKIDKIFMLNPGSLRYNRDGSPTSYALVEVDDHDYSRVHVTRIHY